MGRARTGAVLFPVALTACAKIFGVDDWVYDPGDGGTTIASDDAGGGGDAFVKPADGGDTADACAQTTPDDAHGVFVATSGADSGSCGSRAAPCKTITTALSRGKPFVYVGGGTYGESLTLRAGVTIVGGWSASWTRACADPTAAAIVRPIDGAMSVVANDIGGAATLVTLTLQSKTAGAGESLYGVFATGMSTELTLNDVNVLVNAGGDGATGGTGAVGMPGGTGCPADNSGRGESGPFGAGATPGAFARDGYAPSDGKSGGVGGDGHAGADPARSCIPCVTCPGDCKTPNGMSCGTWGAACGGKGGAGGAGGKGGGSSVAIFAWDAKVTVLGGSLRSGSGGVGGAGGMGGGGGLSGAPSMGKPGTGCTVSCIATCATSQSGSGAAGMGQGIAGGGGPGGVGGGGAGGWSCTVVSGSGADVSVEGSAVSASMGGEGGAGADSGHNGAIGMGATVCQL